LKSKHKTKITVRSGAAFEEKIACLTGTLSRFYDNHKKNLTPNTPIYYFPYTLNDLFLKIFLV
jgi:hypothetical protein